MPRREHQETKRLIQRQQEQQRQGVTVQFQPDSSDRHDRFASQMTLHDTSEQAFAAYDVQHPAPSLPEAGAHLDAQLAPLPRHGEPLTPAQEAALDLLDQFLGDLAREIRNPDSFDRLIDRTGHIGTQIGRAVANALREAQ